MDVSTAPANGRHLREWSAEFIGTALLLYAVITEKDFLIRLGGPLADLWVRVAVIGATVGLLVFLIAWSPLGRRSGAHLNPVVTLGLAIQGVVGAADLAGYVLAQTAGGVFGVVAARMWGPTVPPRPVHWAVIEPAAGFPLWIALLSETAATTAILAASYACLASPRWAPRTPVVAGALLAVCIAGLAPISGAGFNPVRALAPDFAAGDYPALWLYLVSCVAGCLAAAGLMLFRTRKPLTGKFRHDGAIPCYMRCDLPHVRAQPADLFRATVPIVGGGDPAAIRASHPHATPPASGPAENGAE